MSPLLPYIDGIYPDPLKGAFSGCSQPCSELCDFSIARLFNPPCIPPPPALDQNCHLKRSFAGCSSTTLLPLHYGLRMTLKKGAKACKIIPPPPRFSSWNVSDVSIRSQYPKNSSDTGALSTSALHCTFTFGEEPCHSSKKFVIVNLYLYLCWQSFWINEQSDSVECTLPQLSDMQLGLVGEPLQLPGCHLHGSCQSPSWT